MNSATMMDMPGNTHPLAQVSLDEAAEQILSIVKQYMEAAEVEQVAQAIQLAQETCRGVIDHGTSVQILRRIPPLEHALAVATILAQMRIDAIGVAAGVVFEAVDADHLSLERVESTLGSHVRRIVGSMLRLNILERKKHAETHYTVPINEGGENGRDQKELRIREALRRQQTETVRKMFIGMAEDPRVVLLKLIYRLHAMRMLTYQSASQHSDRQEVLEIARETREIYAPLAGRLAMSRVESELEDLAFKILEPDKYARVLSYIEMERKQWSSYVERICTILRQEMASIGLKVEVSGRVKYLYSFYKKLECNVGKVNCQEDLQAALNVNHIDDLIAFRILVESTPDCYVVLGHVHSLWKPKEGRIKDFIATPKTNGYKAVHTSVFCMDEQLVEIQIRTFAMHEMAEYGAAIHWYYKDTGDQASPADSELLFWLCQLGDWQRNLGLSNASGAQFL